MPRKRTNFIVLHCSATRAVQDIGVREIRQWHLQKGWRDIGYHYVIRRDGAVETGRRPDNSIGSHVAGHNSNSLGICLVGGLNNNTFAPENNFTRQQFAALKTLILQLLKRYPAARILGHRDFPNVKKACPCFEAKDWARSVGLPAA